VVIQVGPWRVAREGRVRREARVAAQRDVVDGAGDALRRCVTGQALALGISVHGI